MEGFISMLKFIFNQISAGYTFIKGIILILLCWGNKRSTLRRKVKQVTKETFKENSTIQT